MNAKQNTLIEVMEYHGSQIAFEEINGRMMINATQMAKPFGSSKKPDNWLRTQQAKELLNVVSVSHKCATGDLQVVRQGGVNQGTFFHEDVALFFAQWLSPEFYLACNMKLKELLTKQAISLPPKYGILPMAHAGERLYPYSDTCKTFGKVKRPSATRRRRRHPQHFRKLFGRVFITEPYFMFLKGYYEHIKASKQLKLGLYPESQKQLAQ